MDHVIFNSRTDVNVYDCILGYMDTVKESVLKVDFGRKIPCSTEELNLSQRRAGPTLYQLSRIPILVKTSDLPLVLTVVFLVLRSNFFKKRRDNQVICFWSCDLTSKKKR